MSIGRLYIFLGSRLCQYIDPVEYSTGSPFGIMFHLCGKLFGFVYYLPGRKVYSYFGGD